MSNQKTINMLIFLGVCAVVLMQTDAAFAQSALFDSGTNFLSALQNLLTSTWARIIAIIGVVFLGFAWMFGRISFQLAISVTGGIILVMAAPAIVDSIAGTL